MDQSAGGEVKIVFVSDLHLDATTDGFVRFDDVKAALRVAVDRAKEEADAFIFLGDLCDPDRDRAPRCVEHVAALAEELARAGLWSRWLVGNHDVIEDGSGTSTLEPIRAHESAGKVVLWDKPSVTYWSESLAIVALPFTPRVTTYDPEAFVREIGPLAGRVVLICSHLQVEGIEPGGETIDMPRGRDVFLPTNAIREVWGDRALVLQGHFHRGEDLELDGVRIHVVGALARLTHGEERNSPTFSVIEVAG